MEITNVFYAPTREEWRTWLARYHQSATEIWLQSYNKASGKVCVSYNDAVEEALCFGWIDGITKKFDTDSSVQRFTPRKPKSYLSELNRQRVFKLIKLGKMTQAGLDCLKGKLGSEDDPLEIPPSILQALQERPVVWENFRRFPVSYQKLKIGWIKECLKQRPEEAEKRLRYLIKMTAENKRYGTEVTHVTQKIIT